jgi:hypothetical protein
MPEIWPAQKMPSQDVCDSYHFLQTRHIQMIDEALCSLGDYGEVRLVIEKGALRFLVTQKSYDIFKWQPGVLVKDMEP